MAACRPESVLVLAFTGACVDVMHQASRQHFDRPSPDTIPPNGTLHRSW